MHINNTIFVPDHFRLDYDNKHQSQSLSVVVAQHQNTIVEREIQTIMHTARTFMVHSYFYWTYHGADDISLWSFSDKHAVWLHNCLANYCSSITPLHLIKINKADHPDLIRSHIWGCPVFALDPKLRNDQKITDCNLRYFLVQLLGSSEHHSSLIPNVRHIKTGHIPPQNHAVFDNFFETMYSTGENDPKVNAICNNLFDHT